MKACPQKQSPQIGTRALLDRSLVLLAPVAYQASWDSPLLHRQSIGIALIDATAENFALVEQSPLRFLS